MNEETFKYSLGNIDDYSITKRIGRGKYSNAFSGHKISTQQQVVIKVLKPVRMSKINREISILKKLINGPNITQILDIVRDPDTNSIALIMSYSENHNIKTIFSKMTTRDIATYVYGVLQALDYAHKHGIMHRDVKPGNIMWDQEKKQVSLIDWGLAEFYNEGEDYQVRVATKHYKGPELLLNYTKYTPTLDIWCLGCALAGILFRRVPFFKGNDNNEQIENICHRLGGSKMIEYTEKFDITLDPKVLANISKCKGPTWDKLINSENKGVCTPEAIDLLNKMLTIDHSLRPSAEELMKHPFFNEIRGEM